MIICDQISSPQKNAPIIMKATEILHKDIANAYPEIHKTRLNTLFTFVLSGLRDQRVTVTYLDHGLKSLSKTDKKHDIKRADRLIGPYVFLDIKPLVVLPNEAKERWGGFMGLSFTSSPIIEVK